MNPTDVSDGRALTRVLIVDDHRMFAELLATALTVDGGVIVVGSVGTTAEALEAARRSRPDVVLLDYDLPDADGVSIVSRLKRAAPSINVLMLTSFTDAVVMNEAMAAGCDGFVTKRNGAADVLAAIHAVVGDQTPVSPDMVKSLVRGQYDGVGSDLTERELEVLRLAGQGKTNKEIASTVHLSVNTVRNHMQHILTKLGAHSKLEATAIAVQAGILRR